MEVVVARENAVPLTCNKLRARQHTHSTERLPRRKPLRQTEHVSFGLLILTRLGENFLRSTLESLRNHRRVTMEARVSTGRLPDNNVLVIERKQVLILELLKGKLLLRE